MSLRKRDSHHSRSQARNRRVVSCSLGEVYCDNCSGYIPRLKSDNQSENRLCCQTEGAAQIKIHEQHRELAAGGTASEELEAALTVEKDSTARAEATV